MSTMIIKTNHLIARNNAAVARAAAVALTSDGMAVMQVRRPGLLATAIILGTLVVLTVAKATMVLGMGDMAYTAALGVLQDGSEVDRAAAFLMGVDGATSAIFSALK